MRSIVNRLFYAVGGVLIVIGNVRPDVENICFGEWGKDVRHCRSLLQKGSLLQKDFGWMVAGNAAE
jgi:hypothetical protein